jgi:hypothetical protein
MPNVTRNQRNIAQFKIVHWNANSLRNKIDEFSYFVNMYKPDLIWRS